MILSMTGYGEAHRSFENKSFKIEIKSLNGKTTDIRLKSNYGLKDKELDLRRLVRAEALRGKFDVNISIESTVIEEDNSLNISLMKAYADKLKQFASDEGIPTGDLIQSIIRLPNTVQVSEDGLSSQEWNVVRDMTLEALNKLQSFREHEGESLEQDILGRVARIKNLLEELAPFESTRIVGLKERMLKNLELFLSKDNIDENRYEQEVIYYLEKLDINEEKVRLAQHCEHFIDAVKLEKHEKGKKLSFISQEIGREINTLGAKAQHSEIQQIVVNMKEELEKIKEQVLNIL
ncbi:MAG: YicC family protein [Saprospiraceae bacterium]|nr:YicC family protein [Saprospiraceae bacterium]